MMSLGYMARFVRAGLFVIAGVTIGRHSAVSSQEWLFPLVALGLAFFLTEWIRDERGV